MTTYNSFKTIGIGVTFSPNLKANVSEASRIALYLNAKLVLIHVGKPTVAKQKDFEKTLEPFTKQGLESKVAFQTGERPVEAILNAVDKENIDLLMLGALKRENFMKYYVGSIARKITRQARCSVFLLINPSLETTRCQYIVVNGLEDEKTEKTIVKAFQVAHAFKSDKITIVEEVSHDEVGTVEDDKSLRKTNLLKERIRRREDTRIQEILSHVPSEHKKNNTIETQPIFGQRGYSIGHFAQVARADLLVMNAPKQMGFWDRLFPHDIEHILTELPTDVLIIR